MSVCELQGMSCVSFPNRSWGPHALKNVCLSHAAMKQCLSLLHVRSACSADLLISRANASNSSACLPCIAAQCQHTSARSVWSYVNQADYSLQDPEQSPSQIPGLAGIPKPQRYRDINTLTMELRLADSLPRKPQEPGRAVGGQPQERVSAEKGATTLLSVSTQGRKHQQQLRQQPQQQPQQQSDQPEQGSRSQQVEQPEQGSHSQQVEQPEQGGHSQQAEQQAEAEGDHDAHQLNQQKQLFQAQLDAQSALLKKSQQDAADKGARLAQETAVLQALRLERESYLDLAIHQQEHIFALEQGAVDQQQQAAQLQKQQQEEHQQQQVAAAFKFKAELSVMKRKRQVSIAKGKKSRENLQTLLAGARAGAVRQQDTLEQLAAAEVKLAKGQLSHVKSRMNRHLRKLQSKLRKNRMTPKQALEWGVRHLEAVLADPKWLEA